MGIAIVRALATLSLVAAWASDGQAAQGSAAFVATEEIVAARGPAPDTQRLAVDLDGDGRRDLAFGSTIGQPFQSPGGPSVVVGALRWDADSGRYVFAPGITALRGFSNPRLIPYRRTNAPADGIAVVGTGQAGFRSGERYEGFPLRRVDDLPLFRLERVLAIADLDADGVLEAITASQFGLNRWRFDRTSPELERSNPPCRGTQCDVVALGNFDDEPGLELLLRGPGLQLIDLPDLSSLWSATDLYERVAVGNVDADAALEIVAQRSDAARTEFIVFDGSPGAILGSFPAQCPEPCLVGETFVADSAGADQRVEIHYGLGGGMWRRALPSGSELPSVGAVNAAPTLVAVEDLDGDGRAEAVSAADTAPLPEWWIHDAASLAAPTRIARATGEMRRAVAWERPTGREVVRPIARFGLRAALASVDAEGDIEWLFPPGGAGPLLLEAVDLALADVDGDAVQDLLALDGVDLLAFAGSDRRLLWRRLVGPPGNPFERPSRVLALDLNGQAGDEILLGYRSSVAAFDATTGAELWRVSGLPEPLRQFERIQIDQDPEFELLLADDSAIAALELDPPAMAFRVSTGPARASTVLRSGTRFELLALGNDLATVWSLPGPVLQAQVPHQLGALTALAPVPGRSDLLVAGTFDGRLIAIDREGLRLAATTQSFGSMIGLSGRLSVRATAAPALFEVKAGSDLSFVVATLDAGAPLFRDSFEALP